MLLGSAIGDIQAGGILVMTTERSAAQALRWLRAATVAVCCLVAAACSRQALLEKVTSPQDRALSVRLIEALQSGDSAYVSQQLRPDLRPGVAQVFPQMQAATPGGPRAKVTLVSGRSNSVTTVGGASSTHTVLDYEVDKGSRHALVEISLSRTGGATAVEGLHVTPLARALGEAPPFSLAGKGPLQWLFLALVIAAPLTCLGGVVALILTKGVKRKWLWVIGCLFGFAAVSMNWTTGVVAVQPIYLSLLGAMATATPGGEDWTLTFGIPVVAIVVLARRFGRKA